MIVSCRAIIRHRIVCHRNLYIQCVRVGAEIVAVSSRRWRYSYEDGIQFVKGLEFPQRADLNSVVILQSARHTILSRNGYIGPSACNNLRIAHLPYARDYGLYLERHFVITQGTVDREMFTRSIASMV